MTAGLGTWSGVPTPATTQQWLRCDPSGENCTPIPSATSTVYTPTSEDTGATLAVAVTATNSQGAATADSPATSPVTTPSAGGTGSVAPPAPPTTYAVPNGAILVTTSAQLVSALANNTSADIVLADGTYDHSSYFNDNSGNHLYAQHLGGAVLTAGIALGEGAIVQGLVVDISDSAKAVPDGNSSALSTWGPGVKVLDTVVRGNSVVEQGLLGFEPAGLTIQRCEFLDFLDFGIYADANDIVPYGSIVPHIKVISDIYVDGVTRQPPGSSDGTAEAGIEVGEPVDNGVSRIQIRNVSWMGIESESNSWNNTFSDIDIDMSGFSQYTATLGLGNVGFYFEHFSYYDTLTNFRISGARLGTDCEWNDPAWNNQAACHGTTIENGSIDATGGLSGYNSAGVYLDTGTDSTTVQNVTFENQSFAGIVADGAVGLNSFGPNDYSGMGPTAVPVYSGWMPPK